MDTHFRGNANAVLQLGFICFGFMHYRFMHYRSMHYGAVLEGL